MAETIETCQTCRYWWRAVRTAAPNAGECRRFPPPSYDGWPYTTDHDWCGEYAAKE